MILIKILFNTIENIKKILSPDFQKIEVSGRQKKFIQLGKKCKVNQ